MFSKSSVLFATVTLATSSLAAVTPVRRAQCEGYRPISEVFSIGISQQFVMDVNDSVANPSSEDYGTTKVFYEKPCEADSDSIHELSFVNLEDCTPITAHYERVASLDKSNVHGFWEMEGVPTIPVTPDAQGVARFPCYASAQTMSSYRYEVYFRGYHRKDILSNIGFYDKIVQPEPETLDDTAEPLA